MELNGTTYSDETKTAMAEILEKIRLAGTRVRFHWGDAETGRDWGENYDTIGKIGRSTGRVKIPILIHSMRSMSGTAILTHCIVKIVHANKKNGGTIYEHLNYNTPEARWTR